MKMKQNHMQRLGEEDWAQNCLLRGQLSCSDDPNVYQKLIVDDSALTLTNDGSLHRKYIVK